MGQPKRKHRPSLSEKAPSAPGLSLTDTPQKGFFDAYPFFRDSSAVASSLSRLNFRAELLIGQNRDAFEGRRVLDIAAHDARFSVAAHLLGGAKQVIGIEARSHVVETGKENLNKLGLGPDRVDLRVGDMMDALPEFERGSFDTICLFGILYHTARHYEIGAQIARIGPQHLIIDSTVLEGEAEPIIRLRSETTGKDGRIWDGDRDAALSSTPSMAALVLLFEEFGYSMERVLPDGPVPPGAGGYYSGRRVALRGTRKTGYTLPRSLQERT